MKLEASTRLKAAKNKQQVLTAVKVIESLIDSAIKPHRAFFDGDGDQDGEVFYIKKSIEVDDLSMVKQLRQKIAQALMQKGFKKHRNDDIATDYEKIVDGVFFGVEFVAQSSEALSSFLEVFIKYEMR